MATLTVEGRKIAETLDILWEIKDTPNRRAVDVLLGMLMRTRELLAKVQVQHASDAKVSACQACGYYPQLVEHHWYEEVKFPMKEHWARVCSPCNGLLTRGNMLVDSEFRQLLPSIGDREMYDKKQENHILPSWDIQVAFVQKRLLRSLVAVSNRIDRG